MPSAIEGLAGFTAIDTRAAAVTVSVVIPETVPELAEIVAMPVLTLVASPLEPDVLLMVAMVASEELQCAVAVRSCVDLSVNVPVAVNCCVVPSGIEGMAGVIAIDTSAAGVTVSDVDPVTEPEAAEIVVEPIATLVALPPAEIVATPVFEELHVEVEVRSCVLPSVNVPVAVNAWPVPSAIEGFAGVTAMETNAAGRIVNAAAFDLMDPEEAVTLVDPVAMADASPALLMVAEPGFDEFQTAEADRSWVVPSVKVPIAANCCVVPTGIDAAVGVTEIETNAAAVTPSEACPDTDPEAAVIVAAPTL